MPSPGHAPLARRVLIVEDNPETRESMRLLLRWWGHQVDVAEDGLGGIRQALRWRPDVAIVDIGLPLLDGCQVARQVRAALQDRVCLIALTGYGSPEDRARAFEAGFDHHMVKPADPEVSSPARSPRDSFFPDRPPFGARLGRDPGCGGLPVMKVPQVVSARGSRSLPHDDMAPGPGRQPGRMAEGVPGHRPRGGPRPAPGRGRPPDPRRLALPVSGALTLAAGLFLLHHVQACEPPLTAT
jgi:CheY-like chemotaxis protein